MRYQILTTVGEMENINQDARQESEYYLREFYKLILDFLSLTLPVNEKVLIDQIIEALSSESNESLKLKDYYLAELLRFYQLYQTHELAKHQEKLPHRVEKNTMLLNFNHQSTQESQNSKEIEKVPFYLQVGYKPYRPRI